METDVNRNFGYGQFLSKGRLYVIKSGILLAHPVLTATMLHPLSEATVTHAGRTSSITNGRPKHHYYALGKLKAVPMHFLRVAKANELLQAEVPTEGSVRKTIKAPPFYNLVAAGEAIGNDRRRQRRLRAQ